MSIVNILGFAGSLREKSYNRAALRVARQLLPEDAHLEIFDLSPITPFSEDQEKTPPAAVSDFKRAIRTADAILIATPEYNYSIPGVLKNAIDWASRPYGDSAWGGKPVALLGVSAGRFGTARAQAHLRQVLLSLDMHPLNKPEIMIGPASAAFDTSGEMKDDKARELIRKQLKALVAWTQALNQGRALGLVS
ncbi:NADPH-dependent FMN reductase [Solimonas sp. SE-A11]|uniref:NADPH-dependent FMN reductase n=1 Tax=Solimonas sp. SE-A11 TaxID=3054954 RepID=UPI00259CABAD|nr:NAD(P)H-dependent oxidoreductase [Solimonas sp. SE-A11]MDM4768881.1 NAD(P)H-dependent oxidoreductase [Solimonas sp. SE-A11]